MDENNILQGALNTSNEKFIQLAKNIAWDYIAWGMAEKECFFMLRYCFHPFDLEHFFASKPKKANALQMVNILGDQSFFACESESIR